MRGGTKSSGTSKLHNRASTDGSFDDSFITSFSDGVYGAGAARAPGGGEYDYIIGAGHLARPNRRLIRFESSPYGLDASTDLPSSAARESKLNTTKMAVSAGDGTYYDNQIVFGEDPGVSRLRKAACTSTSTASSGESPYSNRITSAEHEARKRGKKDVTIARRARRSKLDAKISFPSIEGMYNPDNDDSDDEELAVDITGPSHLQSLLDRIYFPAVSVASKNCSRSEIFHAIYDNRTTLPDDSLDSNFDGPIAKSDGEFLRASRQFPSRNTSAGSVDSSTYDMASAPLTVVQRPKLVSEDENILSKMTETPLPLDNFGHDLTAALDYDNASDVVNLVNIGRFKTNRASIRTENSENTEVSGSCSTVLSENYVRISNLSAVSLPVPADRTFVKRQGDEETRNTRRNEPEANFLADSDSIQLHEAKSSFDASLETEVVTTDQQSPIFDPLSEDRVEAGSNTPLDDGRTVQDYTVKRKNSNAASYIQKIRDTVRNLELRSARAGTFAHGKFVVPTTDRASSSPLHHMEDSIGCPTNINEELQLSDKYVARYIAECGSAPQSVSSIRRCQITPTTPARKTFL